MATDEQMSFELFLKWEANGAYIQRRRIMLLEVGTAERSTVTVLHRLKWRQYGRDTVWTWQGTINRAQDIQIHSTELLSVSAMT